MDEEEKQKMVADYLAEQDAEQAAELVPDEVLEAARAEAREKAREQAAKLKEAAADDAGRALDAFIEGKSVEEVKDETIEDLKGKVEEAGDGASGVEFGASDPEGAEEERREERGMDEDEEEESDPVAAFENKVKGIQEDQDCSRGEAMKQAVKEYPDMHAEYLEAQRV